jgi:hypothetical protein
MAASLRVLIGCETSGVMRRAFADRGHDAWSCDLLPSEDGSNRQNPAPGIIGDGRRSTAPRPARIAGNSEAGPSPVSSPPAPTNGEITQ